MKSELHDNDRNGSTGIGIVSPDAILELNEVKPETRAPEKKDPKYVPIKPQAIQVPMFRINGLSHELEKEALEKLSNGVPRDEILRFYGICASDISVICQK